MERHRTAVSCFEAEVTELPNIAVLNSHPGVDVKTNMQMLHSKKKKKLICVFL